MMAQLMNHCWKSCFSSGLAVPVGLCSSSHTPSLLVDSTYLLTPAGWGERERERVKMRVTVAFTFCLSEVRHLFDPMGRIWSAEVYVTAVYSVKSGQVKGHDKLWLEGEKRFVYTNDFLQATSTLIPKIAHPHRNVWKISDGRYGLKTMSRYFLVFSAIMISVTI